MRSVLVVALLFRLAVAPFTEDPWDLAVWREIGTRVLAGASPYQGGDLPYAYPPTWAAWCALATAATGPASPHAWRLALKLPLIAADAALSWVLLAAGPGGAAAALAVALAPVIVAVSAFWGQFDALPALLTVLGLLALGHGHPGRAGVWLGFAASFKLVYPTLALPYLLASAGRAGMLRLAASFAGVLGAALVPALALDPSGFVAALGFHSRRPPQGMTIWPFLGRETGRLADLLTPVVIVVANAVAITRRSSTPAALPIAHLAQGVALITAAFLASSKVVNEQYALWLSAPLCLAWAAAGQRWLARLAITALGAATVYLAVHLGPDLTGLAPGWWRGQGMPLYRWLAWIGLGVWAVHAAVALILARPDRDR